MISVPIYGHSWWHWKIVGSFASGYSNSLEQYQAGAITFGCFLITVVSLHANLVRCHWENLMQVKPLYVGGWAPQRREESMNEEGATVLWRQFKVCFPYWCELEFSGNISSTHSGLTGGEVATPWNRKKHEVNKTSVVWVSGRSSYCCCNNSLKVSEGRQPCYLQVFDAQEIYHPVLQTQILRKLLHLHGI